MNTRAKIQLKIRDFYQKYKKVIFIVLIVWLVIFAINQLLKENPNENTAPSTTYAPHTSIMNTGKSVPEKLQEPIENMVKQYFDYCNNGEYQKAYDMLSDECKQYEFISLNAFEKYIKEIFGNGGKIYNIQDFSNLDNTYIYKVRILDNILANGTTDGYGYYEEKITIKGDKPDNLKLNIGDFINQENLLVFAEDDYLKIEILNRVINYETEVYTVKFTNKTEYPIVLANNKEGLEIGIYIGDQTRKLNLEVANIVIPANTSQTRELEFTKFADDGKRTDTMIFNAIRVLQSYSGNASTYEEEINNAIKLYSMTIKF